jgi:hypothetical protein
MSVRLQIIDYSALRRGWATKQQDVATPLRRLAQSRGASGE